MLNPYRIESTIAPNTFEDLGSGSWYYNYDIKSETRDTDEGSTEIWNYIRIKFKEKPEYKRCVETIIREYITESQEFDLINSVNRILLSGTSDKAIPAEYLEYLDLLDEIKAKVKADFNI